MRLHEIINRSIMLGGYHGNIMGLEFVWLQRHDSSWFNQQYDMTCICPESRMGPKLPSSSITQEWKTWNMDGLRSSSGYPTGLPGHRIFLSLALRQARSGWRKPLDPGIGVRHVMYHDEYLYMSHIFKYIYMWYVYAHIITYNNMHVCSIYLNLIWFNRYLGAICCFTSYFSFLVNRSSVHIVLRFISWSLSFRLGTVKGWSPHR